MRNILICGFLLFSVQTFAANNYTCVSVDQNAPYEITQVQLTMGPNGDSNVTFIQNVGALRPLATELYKSAGVYGGNGRMAAFLKLDVINPHYEKYGDGPIKSIFAEPALASGGYLLRNGKHGGYIVMAGSQYSYARYICMQ
jgi:hypothetical protein